VWGVQLIIEASIKLETVLVIKSLNFGYFRWDKGVLHTRLNINKEIKRPCHVFCKKAHGVHILISSFSEVGHWNSKSEPRNT